MPKKPRLLAIRFDSNLDTVLASLAEVLEKRTGYEVLKSFWDDRTQLEPADVYMICCSMYTARVDVTAAQREAAAAAQQMSAYGNVLLTFFKNTGNPAAEAERVDTADNQDLPPSGVFLASDKPSRLSLKFISDWENKTLHLCAQNDVNFGLLSRALAQVATFLRK